jgi:hypothetical protein
MNGRRHPMRPLIAGGLFFAATLSAQAPAPAPATVPIENAHAPAATSMRWTDPDGKPLPFASEAELLEFLRTAEVKSQKHLSGGITFPRKLLLEKDGIRADAVFRDVDEDRPTPTFGGGRNNLFFRDSYIFEPAAYEMSLLLGLDNVPPATLRKLDGKKGSVQIFVENAMTELKQVNEKIQPPDEQQWKKQVQMMNVFDALVYNTDRNRGNILITPDWRLWMIDHTRAFRRFDSLQEPDSLTQCERGMYRKLKTLDEAVVRERVKDYLNAFEIEALLARRKLIVERLDKLIAERGEDKVLYTFVFHPAPTQPVNPQ